MKRLTAAQAAEIIGITPTSLHRWVRQGRITRHSDGYDMRELLQAEADRDHAALCTRAGISKKDWPEPRGESNAHRTNEIESSNGAA